MIHSANMPGFRCIVILAVAVVSATALAAQRRPVDLSRLNEKEVSEAIARAAPDDVFLVRGRRVTASELQERAERARALAERRRRAIRALPHEPSQLVQQLLDDHRAHLRWVDEQQEAEG